jgi:hypothetical protein
MALGLPSTAGTTFLAAGIIFRAEHGGFGAVKKGHFLAGW